MPGWGAERATANAATEVHADNQKVSRCESHELTALTRVVHGFREPKGQLRQQ